MNLTPAVTVLVLAGATPFVLGQTESSATPTATTSAYEELPELKASEILRDNVLTGPHHKVREEVPTYSGANRFTIDSDFGVFEAEGKCSLGE